MALQPRRFFDAFRPAAIQAGRVAKRLQGRVLTEQKSGATPESAALTAVDLAAQDVILLRLAEDLPHIAVDAEEDTDTTRWFPPEVPNGPVVVVDPIDGTLNYTRGSDDYAVMGALIDDGVYRAAVVHFPVEDVTYWAGADQGAFEQRGRGAPTPLTMRALPNRVLVAPRVPAQWQERLRADGDEVVVSRCSAVDASAPATARARAALSVRRADRRRAIGFLLTVEAGGAVLFGDRPWRREDPRRLPKDVSATVCGASLAECERILRVARG